jgi:hypothetical protein
MLPACYTEVIFISLCYKVPLAQDIWIVVAVSSPLKKAELHVLSLQANYAERPPLVGEVIANFCG